MRHILHIFCSWALITLAQLTTTLAFVPPSRGFPNFAVHPSSPNHVGGVGYINNNRNKETTTRSPVRSPNPSTHRRNSARPATLISTMDALLASPLGALGVLTGIVVVHEAGHYLAARFFNITVAEFSVGFGPKVVGFQVAGNEFNLRALPLGGYVRFPENYDPKEVEKLQDQAREAFQKRRQEEKWTLWQDTINLATFGYWDWQRRQQKKRLQEKLSKGEMEAKPNFWQQLRLIPNNKKAKQSSVASDPEDFEIEYYDDPNLLQNRPWFERAVVLSGGVVFNILLAFVLYFGEISNGGGIPQPVFDSGVIVSQAPRQGAPAAGLLQQGDIIMGVNGNPLQITRLTPMGAQQQVNDVIGVIRQTPVGESLTLEVKRGNQNVEIAVAPETTGSIQTIGVLLGPNFQKIDKLQASNTVEAAKLAYSYLIQVITDTWQGVTSFFITLVSGRGSSVGQSISGPIGLIKAGSDVVATRDATALVLFAGALSVNLGVVNALPIPALDGGQLVFVLAEFVTRRKINQRVQEGITGVALFFLVYLTFSTAFSDIFSIVNGR